MEQSLSKQLADNLRYYVNGETNRRCKSGNGCFYSGTSVSHETEGCFVGRLLTPEDRIKADKYFAKNPSSSSVDALISNQSSIGIEIPNLILDNRLLMGRFQSLHDSKINWDWNNVTLNNLGKDDLKKIITDYELDESEFAEFLIFNEK